MSDVDDLGLGGKKWWVERCGWDENISIVNIKLLFRCSFSFWDLKVFYFINRWFKELSWGFY